MCQEACSFSFLRWRSAAIGNSTLRLVSVLASGAPPAPNQAGPSGSWKTSTVNRRLLSEASALVTPERSGTKPYRNASVRRWYVGSLVCVSLPGYGACSVEVYPLIRLLAAFWQYLRSGIRRSYSRS